jgi:hypothetical protein
VAVYNPVSNAISTFATVANPFSLAVNSNGLVYAGIVGTNGAINVYKPQGQLINTLPVPPGDSPITMAIDSDNVIYQSNGRVTSTNTGEINSYTNDITIAYGRPIAPANGSITIAPYTKLQTYTEMPAGSRYALANDNGQVFILANFPGENGNANVYDVQTLLSGHAQDLDVKIASCIGFDASCDAWVNSHILQFIGNAFSATVDAYHNIFYTDPDNSDIAVAGKAFTPHTLLTNLSSQPFGIAFDKAQPRLYVAFPSEHLVRAYAVTYTTQGGIKIPALSTPVVIR